MGRRFTLRLLFFLGGALPLGAVPPRTTSELGWPAVKAFDPQTPASGTQNWAVTEDADGRVFFANTAGVVSFDGAGWRMSRSERLTPITRAVAHADDGRIYVGSQGDLGWLRPRTDGNFEYLSLLDELPPEARNFEEVFQIAAHGDAVYFTCGKQLLIRRAGRFTHIPHAVGRLDVVAGRVYFHSANRPLERIDGDQLVRVSDDPVFLGDTTRYLGPGRAPGELLVVTGRSGLFHFDLATGRATRWPTAIDDLLKTKQTYRALRLADGSIAIAFTAVTGGGLALVGADGSFLNYLDSAHGLPNDLVYNLAASRHGGLWLCLDYGMAYLDWPAAATGFQRGNGLERAIVSAIIRHDGVLYVGNSNGLFRLVPGRAPQTSARMERMVTGGVFALHADGPDLYGVGDHKILKLTPAGFTTVAPLPTLGYAMLRSRRDPAVRWIGQSNGLRALRETPAGWRDEGLVPGLSGTVRSIAQTPEGQIWVGIDSQGFFRVTPGDAGAIATGATVERFAAADEDTTRKRRARVVTWRDELCFVVGNGQVFHRFDAAAKRFRPFPGLPALPPELEINAVTQGWQNPGQFWFLTVDNDRENPPGPAVHRVIDGRRETLPHTVTAAFRERTQLYEEPAAGVLWIGGDDGLLRVDLARAMTPPAPFRVLARSAELAPGEARPYARNAVDFEFGAPQAPTTRPLEYRSRLTGFSEAWSGWSTAGRRSFTNLREGPYRFEVEVRDADGRSGAPATLAFSIRPPWWRTWWAYGGYGVLFGGALVGFARLRTRALRRKNEQLEKTIAARTEDLRRQNGELARLHKLELDEKISARLAAEKAQLDVLRYQLNPHFLFNSLASIRSHVPTENRSAREIVDRLADFCRLTLHGRQAQEHTTVGEEMAMLRAYLDIEQARLGELLRATFEVDPALESMALPRLMLLPLVENALKYGEPGEDDVVALRITVRREGGAVVFEIANTGTWADRGARLGIPSLGIGHENLRERLRRHYPEAHAFGHEAKDGWVVVRLRIAESGLRNGGEPRFSIRDPKSEIPH